VPLVGGPTATVALLPATGGVAGFGAEYGEKLKGVTYTPLMRPEDTPAIWLNEATMAKYRPELRKYYYDPTKYKTYLDQLGITYPTIR
jgi:hypothetical protein